MKLTPTEPYDEELVKLVTRYNDVFYRFMFLLEATFLCGGTNSVMNLEEKLKGLHQIITGECILISYFPELGTKRKGEW